MLTLDYTELLRYTEEERAKWRRFFVERNQALDIPLAPGGPFPTVGKLVDHIFLVEQRNLQRLRGEPLAGHTGLTGSNASPLFDYGASVRRELEQFVAVLDPDEANQAQPMQLGGRDYLMTPRKLLFHILVHEIRHWAQIALSLRLAGIDPPGDHDLAVSRAFV